MDFKNAHVTVCDIKPVLLFIFDAISQQYLFNIFCEFQKVTRNGCMGNGR